MTKNHPSPVYARQPLRLFYQLYGGLLILIRLPLWTIQAAIPSCRPNPQWSFKQVLMARLTRAIVDLYSKVGITETHTLEAGKEGERFHTIEPFSADQYQGPLISPDDVKPGTVGGTWFPTKPDTDKLQNGSGTVFLQIHGGAFVLGDGRTSYSGFMATTLLETVGGDAVFVPQYRLSGYGADKPTNPFPAALQDVLTSYLYLTRTLRIAPHRIILCGDSAGGNLVIALLRYLEAHGEQIGLVRPWAASAILIAPWVDPLASLGPDSTYTTHKHWSTDYLPVSFLRWGAQVYADSVELPESSMPYVKPLGAPFSTTVPMFVSLGELEILETDGSAWAKEMQAAGCKVELSYEDHAVHDTMLMGGIIGWEESARAVGKSAGEFVRRVKEESNV